MNHYFSSSISFSSGYGFPRFSGIDPEAWISSIERILFNSQIHPANYVEFAMQLLDGEALTWARPREPLFLERGWGDFVYRLLWEFTEPYKVDGDGFSPTSADKFLQENNVESILVADEGEFGECSIDNDVSLSPDLNQVDLSDFVLAAPLESLQIGEVVLECEVNDVVLPDSAMILSTKPVHGVITPPTAATVDTLPTWVRNTIEANESVLTIPNEAVVVTYDQSVSVKTNEVDMVYEGVMAEKIESTKGVPPTALSSLDSMVDYGSSINVIVLRDGPDCCSLLYDRYMAQKYITDVFMNSMLDLFCAESRWPNIEDYRKLEVCDSSASYHCDHILDKRVTVPRLNDYVIHSLEVDSFDVSKLILNVMRTTTFAILTRGHISIKKFPLVCLGKEEMVRKDYKMAILCIEFSSLLALSDMACLACLSFDPGIWYIHFGSRYISLWPVKINRQVQGSMFGFFHRDLVDFVSVNRPSGIQHMTLFSSPVIGGSSWLRLFFLTNSALCHHIGPPTYSDFCVKKIVHEVTKRVKFSELCWLSRYTRLLVSSGWPPPGSKWEDSTAQWLWGFYVLADRHEFYLPWSKIDSDGTYDIISFYVQWFIVNMVPELSEQRVYPSSLFDAAARISLGETHISGSLISAMVPRSLMQTSSIVQGQQYTSMEFEKASYVTISHVNNASSLHPFSVWHYRMGLWLHTKFLCLHQTREKENAELEILAIHIGFALAVADVYNRITTQCFYTSWVCGIQVCGIPVTITLQYYSSCNKCSLTAMHTLIKDIAFVSSLALGHPYECVFIYSTTHYVLQVILLVPHCTTTWDLLSFPNQVHDNEACAYKGLTSAEFVLVDKLASQARTYGGIGLGGKISHPWTTDEFLIDTFIWNGSVLGHLAMGFPLWSGFQAQFLRKSGPVSLILISLGVTGIVELTSHHGFLSNVLTRSTHASQASRATTVATDFPQRFYMFNGDLDAGKGFGNYSLTKMQPNVNPVHQGTYVFIIFEQSLCNSPQYEKTQSRKQS